MKNEIDSLLASFVENRMAAGASVLLTKNGKELYFGCAGLADLSTEKPFARDTLVRVFSMTKLVTAAAVMTLMEKGLLKLSDPVADFIPEFSHTSVCEERDGRIEIMPARRKITVFDLLTMTSGIPYADNDSFPAAKESAARLSAKLRELRGREERGERLDTLAIARQIAACPFAAHPGERWLYRMSTDILGALVAAVAGKSLGAYMKEAIFDPLGMRDTFFRVPPEKEERLAAVYLKGARNFVQKRRPFPFEMAAHAQFESGGAGLISTADDFTAFGQMLLFGGALKGERVLKPETVAQMRQNRLTPAQTPTYDWEIERGYSYGLTMRVLVDPASSLHDESMGSFGWNGAAGTSLRIDPVRNTTLVFGVQRMPAEHEKFLPQLTRAIAGFLNG